MSVTIQTEDNSKVRRQSRVSRLISYFRDDIDVKHIDYQLIVLGFATGIADVMSYRGFSVYSSNQTGNAVIFAIGLSGVQSTTFSSVCASLFGFIIAGGISGQIGHRIGDRRRWWLLLNNFFQTTLIFIVFALLATGIFSTKGEHEYIPILLLAVSFGCQMAMAKRMSCPEVPTVVLTTPFIDFVTDPNLFQRHNTPRNRRLFYIIFFMGGVISGSFIYSRVSDTLPLVICGIVKTLVMLSFFFYPKRHPEDASSE